METLKGAYCYSTRFTTLKDIENRFFLVLLLPIRRLYFFYLKTYLFYVIIGVAIIIDDYDIMIIVCRKDNRLFATENSVEQKSLNAFL